MEIILQVLAIYCYRVTAISLTSPKGMTHTGPFPVPSQPGVVYWDLKWTPTQSQKGDNILCGMAEDSSGYVSYLLTVYIFYILKIKIVLNTFLLLKIGRYKKIEGGRLTFAVHVSKTKLKKKNISSVNVNSYE